MLFLIWFKFTFMNQKSVFFHSEFLLDQVFFLLEREVRCSRRHRLSFREKMFETPPTKDFQPFCHSTQWHLEFQRDTRETRGLYPAITLGNANKKRKEQRRNKEDCFKTWMIWRGSALCHSCFISPQDLQITGKCSSPARS